MSLQNFSVTKEILKFEGNDPTSYWRRFSMLLALSVVVATMGLIRDSEAVVIAAMLMAPMMTPILGIAAAVTVGRIRRAFVLVIVVLAAAGLSTLQAWFVIFAVDVPNGIHLPAQVLARTDPGLEDLFIALAAGVAGAYVQINKAEVSLLPGAAIGVSLVPPLASAGILLYFDDYTFAYEALVLFTTNFGAIILAASVVYLLSGAKTVFYSSQRRVQFTSGILSVVLFMGILLVQLGHATYTRYQKQEAEVQISDAIAEWAGEHPIEIVRIDVEPQQKIAEVWLIVDLPIEASYRVGSVAELLPPGIRREEIRDVIFDNIGHEYSVAVRYQTRIAGLFLYGTEKALPVPAGSSVLRDR